jgi:hypothetical protein
MKFQHGMFEFHGYRMHRRMFERAALLAEVAQALRRSRAVVLAGPRQAGKRRWPGASSAPTPRATSISKTRSTRSAWPSLWPRSGRSMAWS